MEDISGNRRTKLFDITVIHAFKKHVSTRYNGSDIISAISLSPFKRLYLYYSMYWKTNDNLIVRTNDNMINEKHSDSMKHFS